MTSTISRMRASLLLLPLTMALASGCAGLGAPAGGATGGGSGGSQQGVGDPAPELALREFWSGKELRLSSLKGQVVLLDIWASWCAPCKEELPLLDDIATRLRKRGVLVLAVSIDEDRRNAEEFLRKRSHWSMTLAHDPAGLVPDRLQPPKMPTSYVIDARGIVRSIHAGFERKDAPKIEAELAALAGGG